MSGLTLLPATIEQIEDVYSDPYIILAHSTDNNYISPIRHHLVNYTAVLKDKEFLGCFISIRQTFNDMEVHSLLKKKGIGYSREAGLKMIDLCFEDKDITRISTNIYSPLTKAQNYVKKLGFQQEGIRKHTAYKQGKLIDTIIFGLTRHKEIK